MLKITTMLLGHIETWARWMRADGVAAWAPRTARLRGPGPWGVRDRSYLQRIRLG